MTNLPNHCNAVDASPGTEAPSCAASDINQPVKEVFALELPTCLKADLSRHELSNRGEAIVTLAWVRDVLVLAILLALRRGTVALVLDPSERDVAAALVQWQALGRVQLNALAPCQESNVEVGPVLHLDAVVTSVMTKCGVGQGKAQFLQAVASFSEVERVLCKLAGVHRMWWTQSRVVRAISSAS